MAIVYFKRTLVDIALDLIKDVKGTVDKIKAKNDIALIDSILENYYNGNGYDIETADQLDKRLLREYPIIKSINQLSPSNTSWAPKGTQISANDPIINSLKQDRYGIMFDILLKEGLVHDLNDFVDRVE